MIQLWYIGCSQLTAQRWLLLFGECASDTPGASAAICATAPQT